MYALALDPLMRYVITGSDDYMIKIWSMVTGVTLSACRGHTVCSFAEINLLRCFTFDLWIMWCVGVQCAMFDPR